MITLLMTQAYCAIMINSSCTRYVYFYGAFSSNEDDPSCSLLKISHTPLTLGKLKNSTDRSRQYLSVALVNTAEIKL